MVTGPELGNLNADAALLKFDLLEPRKRPVTSTIQLIILIVLGALFGLSALSRRYPHIGWLQAFHIKWPQLSEEQRARMQRRANIRAGIQFILLGFGVPIVYVGSSVMMFNDPSTVGLAISGIIGFALIVLGVIAIWSNRRRPRPPNRDLEFYKRVTGRPWDPPGAD
jgi:O-antigen/teichoic acid export membrane protein